MSTTRRSDAVLREAAAAFPCGEYDTPRLDAIVLLCHAWNIRKEELYMRMQDRVPSTVLLQFEEYSKRRTAGEPVAYITRRREFYGLDFYVDSRVLIPRPDTETLVEWVLESHGQRENLALHDSCSGSGAIAISIKNQMPGWDVSASDISPAAGEVFEINRKRHVQPDSQLPWTKSNLLKGLSGGKFDIITSNPPYLTAEETDDKKRHQWPEPLLALDGGVEGLDLIQMLAITSPDHLVRGGWLYIEAADWQAEAIEQIFIKSGFADVQIKRDLSGHRRITRGRKV